LDGRGERCHFDIAITIYWENILIVRAQDRASRVSWPASRAVRGFASLGGKINKIFARVKAQKLKLEAI
jgi:hypothetical protein